MRTIHKIMISQLHSDAAGFSFIRAQAGSDCLRQGQECLADLILVGNIVGERDRVADIFWF